MAGTPPKCPKQKVFGTNSTPPLRPLFPPKDTIGNLDQALQRQLKRDGCDTCE